MDNYKKDINKDENKGWYFLNMEVNEEYKDEYMNHFFKMIMFSYLKIQRKMKVVALKYFQWILVLHII